MVSKWVITPIYTPLVGHIKGSWWASSSFNKDLGGGFDIFVIFIPILGEDFSNLTSIFFQMGGEKNNQLDPIHGNLRAPHLGRIIPGLVSKWRVDPTLPATSPPETGEVSKQESVCRTPTDGCRVGRKWMDQW